MRKPHIQSLGIGFGMSSSSPYTMGSPSMYFGVKLKHRFVTVRSITYLEMARSKA